MTAMNRPAWDPQVNAGFIGWLPNRCELWRLPRRRARSPDAPIMRKKTLQPTRSLVLSGRRQHGGGGARSPAAAKNYQRTVGIVREDLRNRPWPDLDRPLSVAGLNRCIFPAPTQR